MQTAWFGQHWKENDQLEILFLLTKLLLLTVHLFREHLLGNHKMVLMVANRKLWLAKREIKF